MRVERFGELKVRITGGARGDGEGDGPLVVLLHGYGAPGDDLIPLAQAARLPSRVRFAFPEAPLSLDYADGRAWWMLDLELFERRARGERIDRSEDLPEALPTVRAQVQELLRGLETQLGTPRDRMLLGGFSQGSMVACDAALHGAVLPAGLILLSSTLIARSAWEPRMARCAGLPVLQTHGQRDPLLDYHDAVRLRDLLQAAGANVTFVDFPGGHEIPEVAMDALGRFITAHGR